MPSLSGLQPLLWQGLRAPQHVVERDITLGADMDEDPSHETPCVSITLFPEMECQSTETTVGNVAVHTLPPCASSSASPQLSRTEHGTFAATPATAPSQAAHNTPGAAGVGTDAAAAANPFAVTAISFGGAACVEPGAGDADANADANADADDANEADDADNADADADNDNADADADADAADAASTISPDRSRANNSRADQSQADQSQARPDAPTVSEISSLQRSAKTSPATLSLICSLDAAARNAFDDLSSRPRKSSSRPSRSRSVSSRLSFSSAEEEPVLSAHRPLAPQQEQKLEPARETPPPPGVWLSQGVPTRNAAPPHQLVHQLVTGQPGQHGEAAAPYPCLPAEPGHTAKAATAQATFSLPAAQKRMLVTAQPMSDVEQQVAHVELQAKMRVTAQAMSDAEQQAARVELQATGVAGSSHLERGQALVSRRASFARPKTPSPKAEQLKAEVAAEQLEAEAAAEQPEAEAVSRAGAMEVLEAECYVAHVRAENKHDKLDDVLLDLAALRKEVDRLVALQASSLQPKACGCVVS